MSTLRQDVTTGDWVVIAPQRAARPHRPSPQVSRPDLPRHDPSCPFCPGNEDQTPPEIARRPADGEWHQRAFANLYPALGDPSDPADGERAGEGAHEVIVESPRHDRRIDEMSPADVAEVLRMWRDRTEDLRERPAIAEVHLFRNFGASAGTSLIHPHSQIIATPVTGPETERRVAVARTHLERTGRSLYDEVRAEAAGSTRLLADTPAFAAFVPFAPRSAFETWILPARTDPSFGSIGEDQIEDLAALLPETLGALRVAADDPDYNLVVRSAPEAGDAFSWHVQIHPRTSTAAGFEIGSGMAIDPLAPEDAAAALREGLAEVRAA